MERQRTEKVESMAEKLRQGVLKKVACVVGTSSCTTPPPSWRLELPSSSNCCDKNILKVQEFLNIVPNSTTSISARKLCATLWEIQQYPFANMNNPATRLRRRRRRRHYHRRDSVLEVHKQLAQPPDAPSDQPTSACSFRKHVAESLFQHHRSAERKSCDSQPVSPASYNSSVEVAPYNNLAETPLNSTDFKAMIEDSTYNLTTSKELLKALKRIWSLEEQQESNISAVRALKMELYHSQARLLQEKQMNRHEMENLMDQMTAEKLVRKNREHDRIEAAIRSINEELEDERKLRKRSESLHRKLPRELSEVKSSFSGCLRNLETERKARILLENLCDEFAKGIRDYEQEVHSLRWNSDKCQVQESSIDRLILHISEAWLDERMQMKLSQSGNNLMDRSSIVDKLGFDIETFLHSKRSVELKKYGYSSPRELKEIYPCRESLDSVSTDFHEPKSADGEGVHKLTSIMQINKTSVIHHEKKAIQNSTMKQVQSKEIFEDSELQLKMGDLGKNIVPMMNEEATKVPQKSDRNQIGADKVFHDESVCKEDSSCVKSSLTVDGSIVQLWKSMLTVSDSDKASSCIYPSQASPGGGGDAESSTKLPKGLKENTLMAKLLEARLEGHKSRSRSSKRTP